ncbi:MAG: hypothetical protein EPN93_09785 [Spirochaetes bacterium]|nr:MAG: hypothetical protein EPN93_09785 [Spirochaetota bacterium]
MKRTRIRTRRELRDLILTTGFLPFFSNEIDGYSVMDVTSGLYWWTGDERSDPWAWRMFLAEEPDIAYCKIFRGRAGFVSKEWVPYFASYRRDGYDFDTRYEVGKASQKSKAIMDLFEKQPLIESYRMKSMAGFSKNGRTGFEQTIALLQMQTYIIMRSFTRKLSKTGNPYGWHIAVFSLSEDKFGYKHMTSAYRLGAEGSKDKLVGQMLKVNRGIEPSEAERFLK